VKITIERFKNINRVELDIAPITLLIGGNNSGKSSILQAIQFAVSVAQTTSTQNAIWQIDRLATSIYPSDLIYSPLRDVNALAPNGRLREGANRDIEVNIKDSDQECTISVSKGRNKNITLGLVGKVLGSKLQSFQEPYSVFVPGLAGIPYSEGYETPLIVRKSAARGDSNRVFRNILWLLKQDDSRWKEFIRRLNELFPSIEIMVKFLYDRDEFIECSVINNGNTLPIDSCGTGVLQAIQILSYASLYHPKMLILDEPDSHLHPNNQRKLAALLRTLSSDGLNIIVSTHSIHLVEALIDFSTTHWIRDGAIVPGADNYELKALIEIGALNEGDEIRNAKLVVLTEDAKEDTLRAILRSSGVNLGKTEIWSYHGCSNIQTARALIKYVRKHNPHCQIVIHRDRDCMLVEEVKEYISQLTEDRVYWYIPELCDVEAILINPEHINSLYPEVSIDRATRLITDAYEERADTLREKLVNSRIDFLHKKSEKPNPGRLAVEYDKLLKEKPLEYANGKILLGGVNEALQNILGNSVNLKRPSNALKQELFKKIAVEMTSN
jgi:AAA15 family ATPase/GTPase